MMLKNTSGVLTFGNYMNTYKVAKMNYLVKNHRKYYFTLDVVNIWSASLRVPPNVLPLVTWRHHQKVSNLINVNREVIGGR